MARKELKEYTWTEISTHNTESSCWIVLHNKVFDITSFLTKVRQVVHFIIMQIASLSISYRYLWVNS